MYQEQGRWKTYKILLNKLEQKTPLGIVRCSWEQNIKANLNKMRMWTEFSMLVQRSTLMNTVMGLWIP
jgi:hypothetical protein